ncbi:Secretion monitor [Candidatus Doolittlea endobia]|uniref:Secretion monitor n=1 Tax=Candidatus Doolittlea endobia TaxID=1778262 RepID=A0A143WRN0_9ENTR|nr:Secretion monitor [Candidatus Doolittlea endobia]
MLYKPDAYTHLSWLSALHFDFSQLEQLKNVSLCFTNAVDYCYKHSVICTVLHRLLIAWAIALSPLLKSEARMPVLVSRILSVSYVVFIYKRSGVRITQQKRIRASPHVNTRL